MPAPETWLRSALDAATTAKIYPVLAVQNYTLPLVVYRRSGTRRDRSLGGPHGLPVATFSVSIVSETYTEVKDIAESVRLALDNFTGDSGGVRIVLAMLVSEQDAMERPAEGQAKPLYRVDQVYEVRFQETV